MNNYTALSSCTGIEVEAKNKDNLISFLQVFGIILVVIGHSFLTGNNLVKIWLYTFHMPLFMFISGYLFLYSARKHRYSSKDFSITCKDGIIWKKVKRLLIPYVVISSFTLFPKYLLNNIALHPVDISFHFWVHMLIYPWDNVILFFWFLPTLFIITCLVICGIKMAALYKVKPSIYLILCLLLLLHLFNPLSSILFLNMKGVVLYLFYFVLGYFYCLKQESVNKYLYLNKELTILITIVLSILIMRIDGFGLDIMKAVNGILMSISLGYLYIKHNSSFFAHLYGSTYAIFLFSWFPQTASQQLLFHFTNAHWIVGTLLAIITGVYVPLYIYKFIIYAKKRYKSGNMFALLVGH